MKICPRENVTKGLMRENLAARKYLRLQYITKLLATLRNSSVMGPLMGALHRVHTDFRRNIYKAISRPYGLQICKFK